MPVPVNGCLAAERQREIPLTMRIHMQKACRLLDRSNLDLDANGLIECVYCAVRVVDTDAVQIAKRSRHMGRETRSGMTLQCLNVEFVA